MKIALKKNVIESLESPISDPNSPLSPKTPTTRPTFRSLRNISLEQLNDKSPRHHLDNLTPKSRALRASERIIRKANEIDKHVPETLSSVPTENKEGKDVIPVQNDKYKPKAPPADSSRFAMVMSKRDQEFLTPRFTGGPIKAKDRSNLIIFANAETNEQGRFPKIGEHIKKEKEVASPRSMTNLPDIKMKNEVSLDPKPANLKGLLRSQTNTNLELALDDTQPIKATYALSPRAKFGKNTQLQPIKEMKQDNDKYLSDNGDDKVVRTLKKKDSGKKTSSFRQLIFSPQIDKAVFKKHLLMVHSGLIYATQFLRGPSSKFLETKQISLGDPNETSKITSLECS